MRDTLVLCYHAVSETWPPMLAVRPDRFERQLEHVLERGYVATTFTEAVAAPPAPRTVAITFDDAYRSVYELGLPILERLGLPATVFAPTEQIGGDQPMAWPGIDRVARHRAPGRVVRRIMGAARRARRGGLGDRVAHVHPPAAPRARRPRARRRAAALPRADRGPTPPTVHVDRVSVRGGGRAGDGGGQGRRLSNRGRAGQPLRPAAEPA